MTIKWNHNFNLKTYEPKQRIEINKEEILPHAFRFGAFLSRVGGAFVIGFFFFVSLFKVFFAGKEKIREFQRKREKVIVFKRNY
jgi:hypothetical protein